MLSGKEIARIVEGVEGYNLHSHTLYCDGRDDIECMLSAARAAGMTVWGFTPHSPIPVDSPCNMNAADVDRYVRRARELSKENPDMTVLTGMEVDYLDADCGPSSANVQEYGLDYVIGSVHFVPSQEGVPTDTDGSPESFSAKLATVFHGDLDYVVRTFWQQTMDMIGRGGFSIIGHIDKIARNASAVRPDLEQEPQYRELAIKAIKAAIACGAAIEINTKQRATAGRYFPHPRFWKMIAESGAPLIINSDAHTTGTVDAGRKDAMDLLNAITTRHPCGNAIAVDILDIPTAHRILEGHYTQVYAGVALRAAIDYLKPLTVDYDILKDEV